MYNIAEIPAWSPTSNERLLFTDRTRVLVWEEGDCLKIASKNPHGNDACVFLSLKSVMVLYMSLANRFQTSQISGLVSTKKKLLITFLLADGRFAYAAMRRGGFTSILKPEHLLYNQYRKPQVRKVALKERAEKQSLKRIHSDSERK